jgi:signal transduction histidine kinase
LQAAPVAVTVALLARALRLDRAAVVVTDPEGDRFTPIAVHGDVRDQDWSADPAADAGWSAVLPLDDGTSRAFLLLGPSAGAPLSDQDRALARAAFGGTPIPADPATRGPRDRLAHADRLAAIGTLAAGVAHEIRNPLVSVRTFIQLLPERLDDLEFRTSFRELALGEIDRICGLINDLLAFSRPALAERESTDPAEVARQIVRLLDAEARKHDVRLVCDAHDETPRVWAVEAQLRQVLLNVVLNAIQATPPAGSVRVTTGAERRQGARWCSIAVADTGRGVAAGEVGRIFDPFFTTKPLGSGLGLFIARRIVDDHAGTIHADTVPGGGTVFTIRLPVEEAHARTA